MTKGARSATYAVANTTVTSHRRRKRENGWIIHQCFSKRSLSFVNARVSYSGAGASSRVRERTVIPPEGRFPNGASAKEKNGNGNEPRADADAGPFSFAFWRRGRLFVFAAAAADIRCSLLLSILSAWSGSPHSNTYLSLEKRGRERCASLRLVSRSESARASSSSLAIFAEPQDFWRDKRGVPNDRRGLVESYAGFCSFSDAELRGCAFVPSRAFGSASKGRFACASAGQWTSPSSSTIAADAVGDAEEDSEASEPASELRPHAPVRSPASVDARRGASPGRGERSRAGDSTRAGSSRRDASRSGPTSASRPSRGIWSESRARD